MAEENQTTKPAQAHEKPAQSSSSKWLIMSFITKIKPSDGHIFRVSEFTGSGIEVLFGWWKKWAELRGKWCGWSNKKDKWGYAEGDIQVVPPNFFYGCVIKPRRVCLFVDDSGIVTKAPFTS